MKLLTKELEKKIPVIYATEDIETKNKLVVCKFFDPFSQWTWYVVEGERDEHGDFLFFGLVQGIETEFGYFTLSELESVKIGNKNRIERDLHFTPKKLGELVDGWWND